MRRAAWIIFGVVIYLLAMSALGRWLSDRPQQYDPYDPYLSPHPNASRTIR